MWFHSNPGFDVDRIRYDTNHEVKEALGHRDVGNVRAPDPIDPLDRNPAEEMPSNNSPFGLSGRGSQRCMYSSGGNPPDWGCSGFSARARACRSRGGPRPALRLLRAAARQAKARRDRPRRADGDSGSFRQWRAPQQPTRSGTAACRTRCGRGSGGTATR